jgi:pantetheine-phosphate adenylyltransferase
MVSMAALTTSRVHVPPPGISRFLYRGSGVDDGTTPVSPTVEDNRDGRHLYGTLVRVAGMGQADRIAILGGTFTPIHNGHRALLHEAFQTASHDGAGQGHVIVGLTSTELAKQTRSDPSHVEMLGAFDDRRDALASELDRMDDAYTATFEVIELEDTHGPAATREDVDALVTSPEAKAQRRAKELNDARIERGLRPLEIHTPPFVVAEDGERISSTRIRNGEIDANGFVLE